MRVSGKELQKAGLCAACLQPGIVGKAKYHDGCRPSKHRSQKTSIDGVAFHSKKEAKRVSVLKMLEKNGAISNLKLQVPVKCIVNGELICTWFADAVYEESGAEVYEDVKSAWTRKNPVYRLKKKLVEAIHRIKILET